ncbi:MAG: tetratricopeptide repeat protein [Neisseriaceae bacterium]
MEPTKSGTNVPKKANRESTAVTENPHNEKGLFSATSQQTVSDMDNPEAICKLAICYQNGSCGMTKNMRKAFQLFQRAVNMGDTSAMCHLGLCYQNGKGIAKNEQKAFELFQKAVNMGDEVAIFHLSLCYKNGIGVAKDEQKAAQLHQIALNEYLK